MKPKTTLQDTEFKTQIDKLFPKHNVEQWLIPTVINVTPFSEEDLSEAIKRMKNKKTLGPDATPPEVIKTRAPYNMSTLLNVMNLYLTKCEFP